MLVGPHPEFTAADLAGAAPMAAARQEHDGTERDGETERRLRRAVADALEAAEQPRRRFWRLVLAAVLGAEVQLTPFSSLS